VDRKEFGVGVHGHHVYGGNVAMNHPLREEVGKKGGIDLLAKGKEVKLLARKPGLCGD